MRLFDIIVLGGGHAGVEASAIASRFHLKVALITMPNVPIASAPCNPCIGGVGKGQVVKELDALGGVMPIIADKAGIQYRTLNESKGFAVQSTRVQIDKDVYALEAEKYLQEETNVEIVKAKVENISIENDTYRVSTSDGEHFYSKKIILTVGTFLNGRLHTGARVRDGGRDGCESSISLEQIFSQIKKRPLRFKTGTPPRIKIETVDFSKCEEQKSDELTENFHWSHQNLGRNLTQVSCYLTRTNEKTMGFIRENKEKSPMFNGQINAVGARYCPSIEDKAFRYLDKNIHHVFLEPEGHNRDTLYPSGISSSLPEDIQELYVKTIPGLENSSIKTYGYAVEYDVVDTTDLCLSLEHKKFSGLYFAGQVNGTSGYEEAAGQGFVAGVNAAFSILGREEFSISRLDSYIGVMIEDLVSNTRDEPYRLFTARSENRLYVREDNAVLRLFPYRESLMLNLPVDFYNRDFVKSFETLSEILDTEFFHPSECPYRDIPGINKLNKRLNLSELLRQSWLNPVEILELLLNYMGLKYPRAVVRSVAISKKYEGYIGRASGQLEKIRKLDSMKIDWSQLKDSKNISFECKQRILKIKPETFGQLKRIEGIRPATLSVVAGGAL